MDEKDKELEALGGAPLARVPRTSSVTNVSVPSVDERIALALERIAGALERLYPMPINTVGQQWGQPNPFSPQQGCIHGVGKGGWCQSCYRMVP